MLYLILLTAIAAVADNPDQNADVSTNRPDVIVVVGASGTPEYGEQFATWSSRWQEVIDKSKARGRMIGVASQLDNASEVDAIAEKGTASSESSSSDRDALKSAIEGLESSDQPVWIILIGHGTFNGKVAKFNLRGVDISADDLAVWLDKVSRPTYIINTSSSSGPFVTKLARPGRVIISATKSGEELNFARFGDYFSQAMLGTEADLDKDQQTSLLEAFLFASRRVEEFYKTEGRLATEHALLDDNGDGMGVKSDWFQGVRPARVTKDGTAADGKLASKIVLIESSAEQKLTDDQSARRDALEVQIEELRLQREQLGETQYLTQLESLLLPLAKIYQEAGVLPSLEKESEVILDK